MKSLIPTGYRRPRVVDDAQRRVAVLYGLSHDPQRDQIVDLLEVDLLTLQLLPDAVQPLDAPVDLQDWHACGLERARDRASELLDSILRRPALAVDALPERFVDFRFQVLEREVLQLVLDLAHAEAMGDRGVYVQRLLGDPAPPVLRQVAQGSHVVQAIGQFDQDDPHVVDHRQ